MNKSLLAVTIYNIVILVVFLALAIVFKHWWIVLFSVFFIASFPVTVHKHCRKCDSCGTRSVAMDTYDQALDRAIKDGWKHYDEGNLDYCPKCYSKMTNED
jgi:fatty acid desaturase